MNGILTTLQPFSIHDGPGIRTVVFLKGCNLHCYWCHNPETISPFPQIQYFPQKCIRCGHCTQVCPHPHNNQPAFLTERSQNQKERECSLCCKCVETCFAEALTLCGCSIEAARLAEMLSRDFSVFETSGGGITFSGGEPFLQDAFLKECLTCLTSVHTAVETACCVPWETIAPVLPFLDLFICDLKSMDAAALKQATGGDLSLILNNIRQIAASDKDFWIRTPVIPSFNDTIENMQKMAEYLHSLPRLPFVELLPFHNLSTGKYHSLGISYEASHLTPPSLEDMKQLADVFIQADIPVKYQ